MPIDRASPKGAWARSRITISGTEANLKHYVPSRSCNAVVYCGVVLSRQRFGDLALSQPGRIAERAISTTAFEKPRLRTRADNGIGSLSCFSQKLSDAQRRDGSNSMDTS